MTFSQQIITIALCVAATMATRFLPFVIFSRGQETSPRVQYLGKALPAAVFGMLVVYCLKNVQFAAAQHGLPEMLAIGITIILHLWRGQMLLSIAGGTFFYMLLVQQVLG